MNWTVHGVPAILLAASWLRRAVPADAPPRRREPSRPRLSPRPAGFSTSVVGAVGRRPPSPRCRTVACWSLHSAARCTPSGRGGGGDTRARSECEDLRELGARCARSGGDPDPTTGRCSCSTRGRGRTPRARRTRRAPCCRPGRRRTACRDSSMRADGTIDPATESVLIDGILSPAGNHNAGDLFVGKDGNLYVSTGDGGCDYRGGVADPGGSGCGGANDASRDPNILNGKILRITRAGAVPADNPFRGPTARPVLAVPRRRAWCARRPSHPGCATRYRIAADPSTSRTVLRINDVGQNTWERDRAGGQGIDYGWNMREGRCARTGPSPTAERQARPASPDLVYAYGHSTGCRSITAARTCQNGDLAAACNGSFLWTYVCGKIRSLSPDVYGDDRHRTRREQRGRSRFAARASTSRTTATTPAGARYTLRSPGRRTGTTADAAGATVDRGSTTERTLTGRSNDHDEGRLLLHLVLSATNGRATAPSPATAHFVRSDWTTRSVAVRRPRRGSSLTAAATGQDARAITTERQPLGGNTGHNTMFEDAAGRTWSGRSTTPSTEQDPFARATRGFTERPARARRDRFLGR